MLLVVEDFTQKISFKVVAETSVDTGCIVIVADIITSSWQYPIIKDLFEMLFRSSEVLPKCKELF